MNDVRENLERDCEEVAASVKVFKQAVHDITTKHSELSDPIAEAETALRTILSKSFIANNRTLQDEVAKLLETVERIHELKNLADLGTLVVKADRATENVWRAIP